MVLFPNAKINVGLFVTEKRPDGFHNLETVFYPIGLSDVLEIGRGTGKSGDYFFQNTGIDVGCEVEKNLIIKAYRRLASDFSLPALYIHLHKVIPFGAGLGGGSSDAAFMLKGLNDFFELHIPEKQLERYAAELGSDCAFFIRNRPAFASGKGELLEEICLDLSALRLVLVKPAIGVSTPEAYAGIAPAAAPFDLHRLGDVAISDWKEVVSNDFEKTVFPKYPELLNIKQCLYEKGAVYASMTGSGSALYGFFERSGTPQMEFPGCFVWQED